MPTKLKKEYQCWYKCDYGYSLQECDSLEECFNYAKSMSAQDYYITKKCNFEIKEI